MTLQLLLQGIDWIIRGLGIRNILSSGHVGKISYLEGCHIDFLPVTVCPDLGGAVEETVFLVDVIGGGRFPTCLLFVEFGNQAWTAEECAFLCLAQVNSFREIHSNGILLPEQVAYFAI